MSDATGSSRIYAGNLVYVKRNGVQGLESAAFGGGRFRTSLVIGGVAYIPDYFITDHLGSTRAIIENGQVTAQYNYYPYGGEWSTSSQSVSDDNRYKFSGKEDQSTLGAPIYDFHARSYSARVPMFLQQDPKATDYYSISPYAYCAGNPVRFIDVDGKELGDPIKDPEIRRNRASNLYGENIRTYKGNSRSHQGFDYYAPVGTEVMSVKDGVVVQVGHTGKDYGLAVTIAHADGEGNTLYSFYAHLSEAQVEVDDQVKEGQVIAKSGTTGNASNMKGKDQHLHFELRTQKEGARGLVGKKNPNEIVDTKFESQDPSKKAQGNVGIIKIYPDGERELKNIDW